MATIIFVNLPTLPDVSKFFTNVAVCGVIVLFVATLSSMVKC